MPNGREPNDIDGCGRVFSEFGAAEWRWVTAEFATKALRTGRCETRQPACRVGLPRRGFSSLRTEVGASPYLRRLRSSPLQLAQVCKRCQGRGDRSGLYRLQPPTTKRASSRTVRG